MNLWKFYEGFFDKFKKKKVVQKSDLYISKVNSKKEVNDPNPNKKFYGYTFMDLELSKSKHDHLSNLEKGIFIKQNDYFRPFKFGNFKIIYKPWNIYKHFNN